MYTILPPPPTLTPYVINYWYASSQRLLPQALHSDGCISILFVISGKSKMGTTSLNQNAYFIGPQTKTTIWHFEKDVQNLIGVRLTPLGAKNFTAMPLKESKNLCIELLDAIPIDQALLNKIRQEGASISDKIEHISQWLEQQFKKLNKPLPNILETITKEIQLSPRSIKLADIYDTLHVNSRRVERAFDQALGMTAKEYATLVEVSKARNLLKQKTTYSLTDIAYELEYTDQSHFTRQFKKVMNITPKQYKQRISM
ncbi:helix-turn-helix domain-containing protein [Pseudoalteromonas luteoviolacea]|uniref:helix-turn-helix domain-containing protein n=1 Tax=Pseudoalteromonas luteoviolacea TaxID=43657 RepID=UPI001F43CDBF|nr:helix-turn-helix domain-containing protein [Pseudoalteromonas luteoviolacea]MCF6439644.1 helix-turn-helix domain-containing protein [Pseudoalteromonas luteoviolacea]